jgi:hypothetical protein
MFEFVGVLEKTRERAIYMKRQAVVEDEEGLRMFPSTYFPQLSQQIILTASYTSPAQTVSTSIVAGVPVDNPPGYDA